MCMKRNFTQWLMAIVCLMLSVPASAQVFEATVEQEADNNYATVTADFDLTAVATRLGTDTTTLVAALNDWTAEGSTAEDMFFLVQSDNTLSNNYTQGSKGGFWVGGDGAPMNWGEGCKWYNTIGWNAEANKFSIYLGQYPKANANGAEYTPTFVLKHGNSQAQFKVTYKISAVELEDVLLSQLNIVGTATVEVKQYPRSGYDADSIAVSLTDIAEKLGLSNQEVSDGIARMLYTKRMIEDENTIKVTDDTLTNESTAGAPGFWFSQLEKYVEGEDPIAIDNVGAAGYGNGSVFFFERVQFDAENAVLYGWLGQYPGVLKAEDHRVADLYLVNEGKAYQVTIDLTILKRENATHYADMTEAGSESFEFNMAPDDSYASHSIKPNMEQVHALLGIEQDTEAELKVLDEAGEDFSTSGTTANNGGYWFDANGQPCAWGSSAKFFIEPATSGNFSDLHFGQYPGNCANGDVIEQTLFIVAADQAKYYTLKIKCNIQEDQFDIKQTDWTVEKEYSFTVQTEVPESYECDSKLTINLEEIAELIGTDDPTLYGLIPESKKSEESPLYSKAYSCTPYPGFWMANEGDTVSVFGDSNSQWGLTYKGGVFTFWQKPGSHEVGQSHSAPMFLVNNENGKMVKLNITLKFVDKVIKDEVVGTEDIILPVSKKDIATEVKLDKAVIAFGAANVDEIMIEENWTARVSDGTWDPRGFSKTAGAYFTSKGALAVSGDEEAPYNLYIEPIEENDMVVGAYFVTSSSEEVTDDSELPTLNLAIIFGEKMYAINVKLVTANTYETGVKSVNASTVSDGKVYDLSGRSMNKSKLNKGIYIINGKKHVVK